MKAVFYGSYPAREAGRVAGFLATPWEIEVVFDEEPLNRAAAALSTADALVTSRYSRSDPPAPRIRLLQSSSTGTDRIDRAMLPAGCVLANLYGHEIAIAEYVICAVLDWSVQYRQLAKSFADGHWTLREWTEGPNHREAFGKTVGIVGFGRIGREVARRAKALGMTVHALSAWRSGAPDPGAVDRAFASPDLGAFLHAAHFLVICCPLSDETRGMIDESWFSAMRPESVLIHVGRGPVIDESSLYAALASRRIRGASVDVWYEYPKTPADRILPSRFPFHELDNVVMTPHASGHTEEAVDRRFRQVARNLDALARGERLENVVCAI